MEEGGRIELRRKTFCTSRRKTDNVSRPTPIRDFLDALVHPSARRDPATAERHVAFMAPRLAGSLMALGAFPAVLAWHGVPSTVEFLILAWMIIPIAIACFLSRTGRYETAHALSSFALTCVVTMVAAASGGVNSSAAIWLALIPLEAALSGLRRAVAVAALLAIGGAGLLAAAGAWFGLQPGAGPASLVTLGTLSALIYATGIAAGADGLMRSPRIIREEAQRLEPAFGAADVVTWHGPGGRVVYASANAAAVLGAPPAELVSGDSAGAGLFGRIHVGDRPAFLRALSEAAAGTAGEIEFRLRRPGAADFMWIEMRCKAFGGKVFDAESFNAESFDGKFDREFFDRTPGGARRPDVVAVMRDVTGRKQRQDELIAARTEAERANAAKSRYLASMGHELRTPLNAIIGFSDMLQNDAGHPIDTTRRREYARIISQSGHHLLAVANGILDMARLETGHVDLFLEPLGPRAVIADSVELLALQAEQAGVALCIDAPEDLPEVVADRRAVTQILINLIANAVRFSDRGGAVTIRARVDRTHAMFEVADTGTGMAPDDLARIGHAWFRAGGRRQSGAGLGLSIVKGLVDLHGGVLEASSEPGKGARIAVRLPAGGEGLAPAARTQKRA
jgi:two-component system, cell cycle sensor histidine kinase DivJ